MVVTAETPQFEHESERLVWQRLTATVSPDTVLVPNLRQVRVARVRRE